MKYDAKSYIKKLYKKGFTEYEIVSYLTNKYNDIDQKIVYFEALKTDIKNSKFMGDEDKYNYYFGFVIVLAVSGMLFYEIPIIIPINLSVYGVSIPVIKCFSKVKLKRNIDKEIETLNIIKEYLKSREKVFTKIKK